MKAKSAILLALAAAAPFARAGETMDFYAGSFNIRCITDNDTGDRAWAKRHAAVAWAIEKTNCDAIGLQEVMPAQRTKLQYENTRLGNAGYDFFGRKAGTGASGEETTVVFNTNRFDLVAANVFWLSETPDTRSHTQSWYRDEYNAKVAASGSASEYDRICTWVLLREKATGGVVCFANSHMDLYSGARVEGARLMKRRLAAFAEVGIPVFLVGDHNHTERDLPYSISTSLLKDSMFAAEKTTGPWRSFQNFAYLDPSEEYSAAYIRSLSTKQERFAKCNSQGGRLIDFVYVPPVARVMEYVTLNYTLKSFNSSNSVSAYLSDHYPIYAKTKIPVVTNVAAWTGGGADGKLDNPANWAGGVVPKAGDTVVFAPSSDAAIDANMPLVRFGRVISCGRGAVVVGGGTLSANEIVEDGAKISVAAGAALRAGRIACTGLTGFFKSLGGTAEVGEVVFADAATNKNLSSGIVISGAGTLDAGGYVHAGSGGEYTRMYLAPANGKSTLLVGSGGFSFRDNNAVFPSCSPYYFIPTNAAVVLRPTADYAFAANPFRSDELSLYFTDDTGFLEIYTSDANDPAIGRTVTLLGCIGGKGSALVSGSGTLEMAPLKRDFGGRLAVTNSATLRVRPGAKLAGASIVMHGGTTLALSGSGTVPVKGPLVCAGGSTLSFTITESATDSTLDASLSGVTTPSGPVRIAVAAMARLSRDRRIVLVEGWPEDGEFEVAALPEIGGEVRADGTRLIYFTPKSGTTLIFK